MQHVLCLSLALSFSGVLAAAGEPVSSRAVDLVAPDGTKLAATFYASARPGPGILLLHQCNRDRSTWKGLAEQLAGKGFHVLTFDYRGYGKAAELGIPSWRGRSGCGSRPRSGRETSTSLSRTFDRNRA